MLFFFSCSRTSPILEETFVHLAAGRPMATAAGGWKLRDSLRFLFTSAYLTTVNDL